MPSDPPPRPLSVLASVLAAAGVVLAVAGCSNITPLGPDPAPVSLPPARDLGSPIIMQVMRSQPPTPAGRCPAGSVDLFGSEPNVPRVAVGSRPVGRPEPVHSQLIQASTATPAPPPTPAATPTTPSAPPAGVACYLPVGTPVTITSAAVSAVTTDRNQPGPAWYVFVVAFPTADVPALTALIRQAYDSGDAVGMSVAGTSPRACTATGVYNIPSGQGLALAERWNGRTWRIQPTPAPASSQVSLGGVSCTSARACVAVGAYLDATNRTRPLAEAWNGARWVIQPVPSTAGATESVLSAVSCTSPRACTAIGTLGERALAYRWDGRTWRVQATPNPPRFATSSDSAVSLYGVSCASATACTAIGDYAPDGQPMAFAEAWNGTRWSLQATPAPAGSIASTLTAVSCNPWQCTAVGDYDALSGAEVTLALTTSH
jgi:hypothetical protein